MYIRNRIPKRLRSPEILKMFRYPISLYSELFFSFTCGSRSRSALSRIKSGAGYLETSEKFPAGIIWCRLA